LFSFSLSPSLLSFILSLLSPSVVVYDLLSIIYWTVSLWNEESGPLFPINTRVSPNKSDQLIFEKEMSTHQEGKTVTITFNKFSCTRSFRKINKINNLEFRKKCYAH
jgi:hypothetical protein